MKIPTLFKEYIWLIETINQAGRITFAEINEKWRKREDGGGLDFSRTTFNRHRDAIASVPLLPTLGTLATSVWYS